MNKIDLIIEALENSEPTGTGWVHVYEQKHQTALAAARELKALNPVAWLVSDAQGRYATIRDPDPYGEEVYEPLYAAPPSKPWVGLTDEERNEMIGKIQHDQFTRQRDLIGKTQIITEMYLKERNT